MCGSIETTDAHAFLNDIVGEIPLNDIAEICRVAIESIVEFVFAVFVIDALGIRGDGCGLHRSCRLYGRLNRAGLRGLCGLVGLQDAVHSLLRLFKNLVGQFVKKSHESVLLLGGSGINKAPE